MATMADGIKRAGERWYTAAALAGLPEMPGTARRVRDRAEREQWLARNREGRGGGSEYAISSLPATTQAALLLREPPAIDDAAELPPEPRKRGRRVTYMRSAEQIQSLWARWERLKQPAKDLAAQRLRALHAVEALTRNGVGSVEAICKVAAQMQREGMKGASAPRIFEYLKQVRGAHRSDWLALLAPHHVGRTATAEIDPQDWDQFVALYLSERQNSLTVCFRRVQRTAAAAGRETASERTFRRRLPRVFTAKEIAYARGGEKALDRVLGSETRDRSMYAAMEAVNGDGVLFVPWCVFPTGEIARPKVWVWQCLGTGKILAWRADVSEKSCSR